MNDVTHDQATGEVMPIAPAALEHLDTDITPGLRIIGSLEARAKLAMELAAAIAEFPAIPKSKHVKFFSKKTGTNIEYDYATYADLRKAIDGPLGKHGVVVVAFPHSVTPDSGGYRVTTLTAGHGAEIWSTLSLPKRELWDMKVLGGDFTYLRRYGCAAAVSIEGDLDADDLPAEENQFRQDPEEHPRSPAVLTGQNGKRPAPKAAPAQPAAPKEDKAPKSERPPAQEPLWTKAQQGSVQELGRKLGYGTRPEGFSARCREILGFVPRKQSGKSVLTKSQADVLIAGLQKDWQDSQKPSENAFVPEEDFDEPDFSNPEAEGAYGHDEYGVPM